MSDDTSALQGGECVRLTLAMLTYNSGKYIPESIGNMLPYVDDVVVTVDTRTTDNTRQLLDEMNRKTGKVRWKEYIWHHHYSEAKNELIKMVVPIGIDSWMLIWDDDEKMSDKNCKKFTDYIKLINNNYTIGGLLVPRKNHYPLWTYDEEEYFKHEPYYPDRHIIAVRRTAKLEYKGRVHEWAMDSITGAGYKVIIYDGVALHHHAWKGDQAEMKKHHYYQALTILGNKWDGNIKNIPEEIKQKLLGWEFKG